MTFHSFVLFQTERFLFEMEVSAYLNVFESNFSPLRRYSIVFEPSFFPVVSVDDFFLHVVKFFSGCSSGEGGFRDTQRKAIFITASLVDVRQLCFPGLVTDVFDGL